MFKFFSLDKIARKLKQLRKSPPISTLENLNYLICNIGLVKFFWVNCWLGKRWILQRVYLALQWSSQQLPHIFAL